MVPPLEESEDGNRASFSRWEKRSVISNHFTELNLEIMEMEMLLTQLLRLLELRIYEMQIFLLCSPRISILMRMASRSYLSFSAHSMMMTP